MKDKKSFMFYDNWETQVDLLGDDELRRFIKNLIRFNKNEEIELITNMDKMIWAGILPALEINNTKYKKKVEANRENGKLGGAPKGNQNAKKSITTQNNPNNLIKDNSKEINDNSKLEKEKREEKSDNWQKEIDNRKLLNENSEEKIDNKEEITDNNKLLNENSEKTILNDSVTRTIGEYKGVYDGTILLEHDIDDMHYTMNTFYATAADSIKDNLFKMQIKYKLQNKILETGKFNDGIFNLLQKEQNLNTIHQRLEPEEFKEIEELLLEYLKYI